VSDKTIKKSEPEKQSEPKKKNQAQKVLWHGIKGFRE
jgi:hypothetical protein